MSNTIESRLTDAVANEKTRTELYNKLIAAQMAAETAKRAAADAEYAVKIAQGNIDDFMGDDE